MDLRWADLTEADLGGANLVWTYFINSDLRYADLTGAAFGSTVIAGCNLSTVKGLGTVLHQWPSKVDVDTLIDSVRAAGGLTDDLKTFFTNAGVPRELLDAIPGIAAEVKYYSSFVGYGQPDIGFAKKLVEDLRARGASCWLYSLDHTVGERTWREIGERRRTAEKMIILCSVKSLIRDGLLEELEDQINEDPDKLIPISLDDTWKEKGFRVMRGEKDLKPFLMDRNYAAFSDPSRYQESLNSLLRGLERKGK